MLMFFIFMFKNESLTFLATFDLPVTPLFNSSKY